MDKHTMVDLALTAEDSAEVIDKEGWWGNPFLEANEITGVYKAPSISAIVWWLEHPDMGLSRVRYNVLASVIDAELLPWNPERHTWTDADTSFVFASLQDKTKNLVKNERAVFHALVILAHKRKYDPLLDMLDSIDVWDGVQRAETLLIDFLGAEDTQYTRAVTRHMLNGALMRAFHPGCKYDEVIVLSSMTQGIGKSTLLRKLAMDDSYYTDCLGNIKTKEAAENIQGCWIVEIGELESLRKREVETVKLFLSRQDDRYRTPFARFAERHPRRCIFVGTTNSTAFLADRTGNRRFLPVACNVSNARLNIFDSEINHHIQQVWAEVIKEFKETGALPLELPPNVRNAADMQRESFSVDDPKEGLIVAWLQNECRPGQRICILEVMANVFEIPKSEANKPVNKALQNEISQILDRVPALKRLKGKPKHSDLYGQTRCWEYHLGA